MQGKNQILKKTGAVAYINEYYPFGLVSQQTSSTQFGSKEQRYKYNGKELMKDFGLESEDYGARLYSPQIGRWQRIDPLAYKMPTWSPYSYTFDNPLKFTDPTGEKPIPVTSAAFRIYAQQQGMSGNQQIGAYFERLALASLNTTSVVFHNTTKNYESPIRARMTGGSPSAVRPDGISTYVGLSAKGETFFSTSFYEAKSTSATITSGYRKGQITGMIDALGNSNANSKEYASLTLVTTSDTKISPELLEYAAERHVKVFQSVAAIDDETGQFILSEKTLLNGNPISTLIDKLKKLNGNFDEYKGVDLKKFLKRSPTDPTDPDPAAAE